MILAISSMRLGHVSFDVADSRSKIIYNYDFGDDWRHQIKIEKITDDESQVTPYCLDGARACPPEDSGGPWGYQNNLKVLADPDHEDYQDVIEWMGDKFDPEKFNRDAVNRQLQKVFKPEKKRAKKTAESTKGRRAAARTTTTRS